MQVGKEVKGYGDEITEREGGGCEKCTESEALQIICKKNVILGKCRWYPHTTRGDRIRQKHHDGMKESKTKQ